MDADILFNLPDLPRIPVTGRAETFPVRRIFCVGRNYEAHAREMGNEVDREAPFYFTKTPWSVCLSDQTVAYPPGTTDYHHEMELVVALGAAAFRVTEQEASNAVFGYACGLDMTRRDLQAAAKEKRRSWDLGKDVENSAVIAAITPASELGALRGRRIGLDVNGETRQSATLDQMVWSVPEIIAHLSGFYHLMPGDLIFTGTPAGVGPVVPGDRLTGEIDGLSPLTLTIGDPE